jgi:hypothetical protein
MIETAKMIGMTPAALRRQRDVGGLPAHHLASDHLAGVLHRDAALGLLHQDHARDRHHQQREEDDEAEHVGLTTADQQRLLR